MYQVRRFPCKSNSKECGNMKFILMNRLPQSNS